MLEARMTTRMTSAARRQRATRRRSASCWLPLAVAVLAAWPCDDARADESDAPEDGATLVRNSSPDPSHGAPRLQPEPETASTLLQFARELTWARWILADDGQQATPEGMIGPTMPRASTLGLTDLRGDHWQAPPMALAATASALGSTLIAGLPVLGVVRGGKVRQRHFVRAFFRSRGVALVWRIEF
jgi:hypothetical protein